MSETLVRIADLSKDFTRRQSILAARSRVRAVCGVSLEVSPGETLGVVGESGCGKSTLGRMAAGLLRPSSGEVFIRNLPLWDKSAHGDYAAFRKSLAGVLQMVFQDPYSSLNPRMRVGDSVAEPLACSLAWREGRTVSAAEIRERARRMLAAVGLDPDAAGRWPHEFSGGQRQRIAIARALVTHPAFVVCDEPTSSLDASVQSQVLNLLRDMQDELGLAYLFISHDLAVVRHMSDRTAVMYRGFLVEEGGAEALLTSPCHPYTRLLLESVPGSDTEAPERPVPALSSGARAGEDGGCPFAPRCPERFEACLESVPDLHGIACPTGAPDRRRVRCRLFDGR